MPDSRYEESSYRANLNKYYCPKCNEKLKAVTTGDIVNARPGQKKDISPVVWNHMFGKMKTYRTEFQCPICRLRYTLEDLRKIEQKYKKKL